MLKRKGDCAILQGVGEKGLIWSQFGLSIQQHRNARSRLAITATAEHKGELVNCQIAVAQRLHGTDIKCSRHVEMQVNGLRMPVLSLNAVDMLKCKLMGYACLFCH